MDLQQPIEDEDIPQRLLDIEAQMQPLAEWMNQKSWIPRHEQSFFWWTYFESSNWVVLPFGGGLADQPNWVFIDFSRYNEIAEFHNLFHEKKRLIKRQLNKLKGKMP